MQCHATKTKNMQFNSKVQNVQYRIYMFYSIDHEKDRYWV